MNTFCKKMLVALGGLTCVSAHAQVDDFESFRKQLNDDYDVFVQRTKTAYDSFRDSVNAQYAEFMRNPWKAVETVKPVEPPVHKETPPDVVPDNETPRPVKPRRIKIEVQVTTPPPVPQPQPVEPIRPVPAPTTLPDVQFQFYGTAMKVRGVDLDGFTLRGNNEKAFAEGWKTLSCGTTNNLINDCLSVRETYSLSDWAYIRFLDRLAARLKGQNANERTLLQGFLLTQSGYKVRFCRDEQGTLHLLFCTDGVLYGRPRYKLGNDWFYTYTIPQTGIYVCDFGMPKEQKVSMTLQALPRFSYAPGTARQVNVKGYPTLTVNVTPNKNLIDFFNDWPECAPTSDAYSKWALQGNTPASPEVRTQLYPALRKAVQGKSQYEAVQLILKVAQSFPYEYDDKVWGRDRVFWMDESWQYPYSDCEDHAINFSRMVRDILGLDVCLVYYPGHLSACVALTDGTAKGDYIDYKGKSYMVCDATYFYASAGLTAPSNDNAAAILVPLRR